MVHDRGWGGAAEALEDCEWCMIEGREGLGNCE